MGMKNRKLGFASTLVAGGITMFCCAAVTPANAEVTSAQLKNQYGSELQVLGDVESIDLARGVLVVAGQHISIAKDTEFSYNGIPVEDQVRALRMIQPGDLLAVFGPLDAPVHSVSRLKEAYVAGATTLFVKAKVFSVQQSMGRAKVDQLGVDFTPAMADAEFVKVEPGQVIEAVGIQPTAGGLLSTNFPVLASMVKTSTSAWPL